MATMKEVSPDSSIHSEEVFNTEQNSFGRFLGENKELFDRHSFLTYELRDEEAGWKNSPTVDSLVNMGIAVMCIAYPQTNMLKGGKLRQAERLVRGNITRIIFSNAHEKSTLVDSMLRQSLSAMHRISPQNQALLETMNEAGDDFKANFNDAISPLVSGIRESKAELMGKFEDFLLSSPSNIFAFSDFLSDKKNNGAKIEAIRPFLSSLADSEQSFVREKKDGILRRIAKKWTDELKEKPNPATIDEYALSIKSKSSNIREWLEFAAQGVDIASFLRIRPDVSSWTTELREALFAFVSSRYSTACSSAEKELREFKRFSISKPILPPIDFELDNVKSLPGKIVVKKEPDDKEETLETAENGKYPIGVLTKQIGTQSEVRALTEEELTRRLQKEADSLAPEDQRMKADLEKIFLSLRKDPYGLGTEKLIGQSYAVGYQSFPLRSINPRKRIGLSLDRPDSHDIRIVYVIYKNNSVPSIGLEGVYRHNEYMGKFKYGK